MAPVKVLIKRKDLFRALVTSQLAADEDTPGEIPPPRGKMYRRLAAAGRLPQRLPDLF
jgi:hypothetical protein